ncbi:hypothetical protein QFC22_006108 [Naganishia vaughanmartiniae]|uniref:Uncharacterized protein n=1 Tax=Naganishia vaughanmartiniae TaxID=1424756 RepID=A0ACC2WR34_9TREE|nr:hypothetical protein QFC22_006108 [Naganishia vaughanmartiniae]
MDPMGQAESSRMHGEHRTSTPQLPVLDGDDVGTGKKRKIRHIRVKTGCRDCRMRRIKCPEGIFVAEGAKLPCEKCDETGTECWYPAPDDLGRTTTRWVRAAVVDKEGRVIATGGGPMSVSHAMAEVAQVVSDPAAGFDPAYQDRRSQQQSQIPTPLYHEIKQERPPSPLQYLPTQLRLPYFDISEAPIAGPSHQGPAMFAESSMRQSNQTAAIMLSRAPPFLQHPPIQPPHWERAITLPRIPKGPGTYQEATQAQWHGGTEVARHPALSNPSFAFAQQTHGVPSVPTPGGPSTSSQRHHMTLPSTLPATNARQASYQRQAIHPQPQQAINAAGGEFRLQMTRMPWVKRKPMHVDHTRSTGGRSQASLNALLETYAAAASPLVIADNLHRYLASVNMPVRPLRTFTLASMLSSPLERMAMAYFETRGCVEIVAAGEIKSNWIYAQVFPRVYELLTGGGGGEVVGPLSRRGTGSGTGVQIAHAGARRLVKEYVHHSLIRLSCVHRANMESEPSRIEALRREVKAHEKMALKAGLMARVHFPESAWKTEEYLYVFPFLDGRLNDARANDDLHDRMGTFIGYMADMLDSRTFQVDLALMVSDARRVCSGFETILRDMVAVYHTLLTAFTPHDPLVPVQEHSGVLAISTLMEGRADVMDVIGPGRRSRESTVGGIEASFGRPASAPAPATATATAPAPILKPTPIFSSAMVTSAPGMAQSASSSSGIEQDWVESFFGLTREMIVRVGQVNAMVASRAELLRNGTEDGEAGWTLRRAAERMVVQLGGAGGGVAYGREEAGQARHSGSAFEVVEMAPGRSSRVRRGTSVAAIYTRAPEQRTRITSVLQTTETWSFGPGYVDTTREIMGACWKVLDEEGGYRYGIAPWREAMAVTGRSMYL